MIVKYVKMASVYINVVQMNIAMMEGVFQKKQLLQQLIVRGGEKLAIFYLAAGTMNVVLNVEDVILHALMQSVAILMMIVHLMVKFVIQLQRDAYLHLLPLQPQQLHNKTIAQTKEGFVNFQARHV